MQWIATLGSLVIGSRQGTTNTNRISELEKEQPQNYPAMCADSMIGTSSMTPAGTL